MHNGHRRIAHGAALAGLVTAGLAVAHAGPGVTAIGPVRRRAFPRLAGLGRPDHVALTFDDGPDPASTPAFLDLLAARRVHATFFLLGSMVARSPQLAARDRRGRARDRRPRLGPPVHDPAQPAGRVQRPGPRQRRRVRGYRHVAPVLPPSLRCPELGCRHRRPEAGADDGPVEQLGKGMGARRHPGFGVRRGGGRSHRRRNDLAPRLRLHLASGGRLGGARRAALAAGRVLGPPGWPWGPWPTTVSGERCRVSMAAQPAGRPPARLRQESGSRNVVLSQARPKS